MRSSRSFSFKPFSFFSFFFLSWCWFCHSTRPFFSTSPSLVDITPNTIRRTKDDDGGGFLSRGIQRPKRVSRSSSPRGVFLFARAEEEEEEEEKDEEEEGKEEGKEETMTTIREKKKKKKTKSNKSKSKIEQTYGDSGEIIVEDLTDPKNFDERRGDVRSTHQMFEEGADDDATHALDELQEIGRSVDDVVDDGGPAIPRHYVCNACQASARKLDADLSEEELKRARGAKYGKKLEEMYYLDAIEKSCDDHSHWHLYHAHVYDSGYHYLAGPLLGNASSRGSKPFVRDFSKHRWPKRLRDYCQVLVNEFDEEGVYAKHYELQEEKLLWEEEKRKEEEEESELEKTMTAEEIKLRRKKKRREEILHPYKKKKKRRTFDLAKKLCYQSEPPKCTFDNEFKKRAFLQLATHEEEQRAKETQNLGWSEREGDIGGIRYEPTKAKKKKKVKDETKRRLASSSSSSSSSSSTDAFSAPSEKEEKTIKTTKTKKKNKKSKKERIGGGTNGEKQTTLTKEEL
tara:strand:+ start:1973 stop:3514 length:1542 start_codon:yes stop_codon:yes gene_type:complete